MSQYDLVAGDGGSTLRVTVKDNTTDDVVDLTGKTIQVRFALNGGTVQTRSMSALNQTTNKGQADYLFTAADLALPGDMKGEVRLQAGLSDQITTVDTFYLRIKAPLT